MQFGSAPRPLQALDRTPIARAWVMTLILAALSAFSFLDRQALALLTPDLVRQFAVTDVQIGVLLGPAFIIPYNLLLLPAALAVDRYNRHRLIVVGVVIWTGMTIASGFAQSFAMLIVLRAGMALGEALLGPAAISMLGDMFVRESRPLPTAAYIAGSVIGNMGSPLFSAAILHWARGMPISSALMVGGEPWRWTLIGVGLPGLVLGLLLAAIGREPPRPALQHTGLNPDTVSLRQHLRSRGTLYAGAFVGLGLLSMVGSALALWGPSFVMRAFELDQVVTGYDLGLTFLIAGILGTIFLPAIFRQCLRARRVGQVVPITIGAILFLIVGAGVGGSAISLAATLGGFAVSIFVLMGVGTLPTLFIQLYAPSHLKGRITALLFFVIYILSNGLSPVAVPWIADMLFSSKSGATLGHAIAAVAVSAGILAIVSYAAIHRPLLRAEGPDVITSSSGSERAT